jgi:hypothetical protein
MDAYSEENTMSARYLKSRLLLFVFFCVLGAVITFPTSAQAYLDPGSGSMLLQILLGGAAGLAVLFKLYWHRFLLLFGIQQPQAAEQNAELDAQPNPIAPSDSPHLPNSDDTQAEAETAPRPE